MPNLCVLSILSLLTVCAASVAQQPDDSKKLFESLTTEIDKLLDYEFKGVTREQQSEVTRLWRKMTKDVRALKDIADKRVSNPSPEYLANLRQNKDALSSIFDDSLSTESKLDTCRAIAKDIDVKVVF